MAVAVVAAAVAAAGIVVLSLRKIGAKKCLWVVSHKILTTKQ